MPAKSKKQRIAMAIAEHAPDKLYARNKGMKKMSKGQLHDFASTSEKGLPAKKKRKQPIKKFITQRNRKEGKVR
jgi:hypothetical protein